MRGKKPFLTTFEVSGLLGVTPQTVCNWVDDGRLEATRTPGGHRRIPRAAFERFAVDHGYDLGDYAPTRALVFDGETEIGAAIAERLSEVGMEVRHVRSAFEAGLGVHDFDANALVVNATVRGLNLLNMASSLRSVQRPVLILAYTDDPNMSSRDVPSTKAMDALFDEINPLLPESHRLIVL